MISISGYSNLEPLGENTSTVVVAATQNSSNLPVVLKYPHPETATLDEISRIHSEYETLKRLKSNYVVGAVDLIEHEGVPVLVLEHVPQLSLAVRLKDSAIAPLQILRLGRQLAHALDDIHSFGLVYKNLNPANILVNDDFANPRLVDFSIAIFDNLNQAITENPQLEGAVEYISPEQTGRLNRALDYRADLYSLGATLYELATGAPPFTGEDFLELIFQHLARAPEAPSLINSSVPKTLDKIILKLLAKEPEDRYQSTFAIISDLKRAEDLYQENPDRDDDFAVALDDIPEQLSIPNKLLQRDAQLRLAKGLIEQATRRPTNPLVISGEAGVGKTVFLTELTKIAAELGGMQCFGKASLVDKDIPYSTLSLLLSEVCRQLLSRDDLSEFQNTLYARLGQQLPLLLTLCPDLQRIIGHNSQSQDVQDPLETRSRLKESFSEFISIVAEYASPLVICLDNGHWFDASSLDLLGYAQQSRIKDFLLIMALRYDSTDGEVRHYLQYLPFERTEIELHNLDTDSVKTMLASCTFRSPQEVEDLAAIIQTKTRGNPQALKEFLGELHTKNLLYFDRKHREWAWNIDQITSMPPTNNVGEVLANNLTRLEPKVLEMLKVAACVGDEFTLDTIKRVSGLSFSETSSCLVSAVSDGFLLYADGGRRSAYRFAHEQIQRTAYQLLNSIERGQIHAQIGKTYLSQGDPDSRIFEVVNQLNNSLDETELSPEDRLELAQLNLSAGRKAKNSAAFQASFRYFRMAIAVQGKQVWENYDLSMSAHLDAAEAAYFCGDKHQLNSLVRAILNNARTTLEKTQAYEIQLKSLVTSNELDLAIDIGHQVLELLNQKIPKKLSRINLAFWSAKILVKARLLRKTSKTMTNPEELAAMRILRVLCQAGYLAGRFSTAAYTLKMTELSLDKGLAPESSFAYPLFGAIIIRYFGTVGLGHEFGNLALRNLDDSNQDMFCVTHAIVHSFVSFWKQDLRASLEPLAKAESVGFEHGDIEFAQIAGTASGLNGLITGQDLNTLNARFSEKNKSAREFNQRPMLDLGSIFQQAVQNLLHDNETPEVLAGMLYNEQKKIPEHRNDRDYTALANLFIVKSVLAVIFRNQEVAFTSAVQARNNLDVLISSPLIPFFTVFESIIYLQQLRWEKPGNAFRLNLRIRRNVRNLRKWSQHAPMNVTPGYQLVLAELARIKGNPDDAIRHYEQAMASAEKHGQNHMLAIAQEFTGRFFERQDSASLATYYLLRARNSYVRWGAAAKVQDLDRKYRDLADQGSRYFRRSQTIRDATEQGYGDYLDLGSVLKASQVLSGEIILNTLLEKLMQVALENAGAHSAGLVLADNDDLWVEIQSRYNGVTTDHRLQRQKLSESDGVPASIIQYVARTEEDLVIDDASQESMFSQDSYINRVKPRSVLCVPILSKSHLTGVLYLENLQSKSAFSEDRVSVLRLLASQSAIAIENAKLYQQLNESRDKYLSLYENAVEGIFEIDMNGELISVNPAAAQLMGYSDWINAGKRRVDFSRFFVEPDDMRVFTRRLLAENRVVGFETMLKRLDTREIWVAISAHIIFEKDKPSKVDGSIIDITERKLRQQAEQATRMAEAATQTKSQFLANMSHEIRTPMNAILGYTRLALETELSTQQHIYLNTIKNSSDHLLRVVNDILDISKIESGKLELQNTVFELNDVLGDVQQLFKLAAEKKGLELLVNRVESGRYRGDPVRLGQVLINLVSNAIKFTERGIIMVNVEVLPLQDGTHNLNFEVTDTGRGIAVADLESIFDTFNQGSHTGDEGGTGLGLTISRNIVEMMHGEISVTSSLDAGSKFKFNVILEPVANVDDDFAKELQLASPTSTQNILLVEDNPINRDLAREVLASNGYNVIEAEHGQEALDKLPLQPVFAILMDMRMPVMSGNEAIKHIRGNEATRHIPVIALSAGVLQHEIDEALANGFDHYITKPVDFAKVLNLLSNLQGKKSGEPIPSAATTQSSESSVPPNNTVEVPEIEQTPKDAAAVDFQLALKNHDNDAELLNRLLGDFVEFYADSPGQLESALKENRLEAASRLMHNLAGLTGTFGAAGLMKMTREYEKAILKEDIPSRQQLSDFETGMASFVEAIKRYLAEEKDREAS